MNPDCLSSREFTGAFKSLTIIVFLLTAGCSQIGQVKPGPALAEDTVYLKEKDLAGLGSQAVKAERFEISHQGKNLTVVLYQPAKVRMPKPAIVFLPGLMAAEEQYDSYARALASRGFTVAVHGWYSPLLKDEELSSQAIMLADWLVRIHGVDAKRIGIVGHSMGAKDAVLAASQSNSFAGVVAIDPDDAGELSVVSGPLAGLRPPLLLIGAEVAWRAASICAPKESNYERFFEKSPRGTLELTLRDADHVQMLDEPDRFGYGICRCGTADSRVVRVTTRRATVEFFLQHLQHGPTLSTPPANQARLRVAQGFNGGKDAPPNLIARTQSQ